MNGTRVMEALSPNTMDTSSPRRRLSAANMHKAFAATWYACSEEGHAAVISCPTSSSNHAFEVGRDAHAAPPWTSRSGTGLPTDAFRLVSRLIGAWIVHDIVGAEAFVRCVRAFEYAERLCVPSADSAWFQASLIFLRDRIVGTGSGRSWRNGDRLHDRIHHLVAGDAIRRFERHQNTMAQHPRGRTPSHPQE